jgi:hypothetical protein
MKIVFDFAAQQITIEDQEPKLTEVLQAARQIAPLLSHIQIVTKSTGTPKSPQKAAESESTRQESNGGGLTHQTLKQFVKGLPLSGASERIAAIAYYMRGHENRETFSPKEMDTWFTIAGLQKPKLMPVAVFDAKRHSGYVENASHGQWKLTVQGENLIVGKLNDSEEQE